jgi:group I intron endonuclease
MTQVIYKIINLVNDKFYVGSTTNQRERFRTHRKKLRRNVHHCAHLQAAWNKYGEEKFAFKVAELVPDGASLQAAEDRWLEEHFGKEYCYNTGRRSGAPWRDVPKEQHPAFGIPKTEEQRAQISATLKEFYAADYNNHPRVGKTHSDATKAKISASKKANPTRYWAGKERSEETRAKISEAQKGVAKPGRVYTEEGLAKAREVMRRNAKENQPVDFESVKAKFPPEVLAKYDFSEAIYTGALVRIEGCKCPAHGVFSQYAAQFRKGRGCPQCGAEQRAESKRQQMKKDWGTSEGRKRYMKPRKSLAHRADN